MTGLALVAAGVAFALGVAAGVSIGWGLGVRSAVVWLREELEPEDIADDWQPVGWVWSSESSPSVLDSYHREAREGHL